MSLGSSKGAIILVLIAVLFTSAVLQVDSVEVVVGQSCAGVQTGAKFTNAENCRTYIVCYRGLFELEFCPSGFFNPAKNDCDLDYKCKLDNLPEETTGVDWTSTSPEDLMISSTPPMVTTSEPTTTTTTTVMPTTTPSTTTTTGEIPQVPTTESSVDSYSCPAVDTEAPTYLNDRKDCER